MKIPGTELFPLLSAAAGDTGLPWWLLYSQIEQESDFDPEAVSPCGALGLLQLMPSTFPSHSREELLNPEVNLRLGSRYLARLRDTFHAEDADNRLQFALAAYNGGIGYVLRAQALALRQNLNPTQWSSLAQVFPEVQVFISGRWRRPDSQQVTHYVARIWSQYQARQLRPIPGVSGPDPSPPQIQVA